MKKGANAARGDRPVVPFLPIAALGTAILVAVLVLAYANAVELENLARENSSGYKENVIDQSSTLTRVIFAAHRVMGIAPLPGESPARLQDRRLRSSEGLLSHAQYVRKIDPAFLGQILGPDPLMLGERTASSDRDYEAALASLRVLAERAAAATAPAERGKILDAFETGTGAFMGLLEARSMLLVQMEDYLYTLSKQQIAHVLRHSSIVVLSFSVLFIALGVSIALYLRSMFRYQAELARHRNHLSEMVEQRTDELSSTNELLRATLKEKETLLKEVYHRVKNNLTMVNSLISLQKSDSPPGIASSFEDLESRVAAISLIHEKLYKSPDLENIILADYLVDLASSLVRSLREDPESIRVECSSPAISLPADVIIPLGLMATEIVTNSIKHGFRGRACGLISIRAETGEGGLRLAIGNDGLPPERPEAILESHSLGSLLIHDLCAQLDGSFELSIEGGTHYNFSFPKIA